MECETILDSVAAPADVLGLDSIVGLTPPPEEYQDEQMIAYSAGQVRIINQSQLSILISANHSLVLTILTTGCSGGRAGSY